MLELGARNVRWIQRFSDLGIRGGAWPLLGRLPDWYKTAWPMPAFGQVSPLGGLASVVEYADDDPGLTLTVTRTDPETARRLPEDGLAGAQYVEKRLARLLET